MSILYNIRLLSTFFLLLIFLIGFSLDQLGYKTYSVTFLAGTIVAILALPTRYSLYIILFFIWFQGFFKIVSGYHPLIHVGADIIVLFLMIKLMIFGQDGESRKLPLFTGIFLVHFIWVAIEYFNPYSLGITATIAGSKIYVTMFLLYFLGYFYVKDLKEVKNIFLIMIALAFVQTVFAIYQGYIGPTSVLSIHPGYQQQLEKYGSYAFRPFGLTNLPGGPSVYVYTVIPFILYFIITSTHYFKKLIFASVLPLITLTLIFCQVRSAVLKGLVAALLFLILCFLSKSIKVKRLALTHLFAFSLIATIIGYTLGATLINNVLYTSEDSEDIIDRSLSSFDISALQVARRGAWERFTSYLEVVPFGAGYSRVGASAGAFADLHAQDVHFSKNYFFTDNLFILLLVEIGLPGLFIVSILIGSILFFGFKIIGKENRPALLFPHIAILSSLVAIFIGSYGAEGIVYNPESCFFWLFSGIMVSMNSPDFNFDLGSNDV